jgi:hypothetical protein
VVSILCVNVIIMFPEAWVWYGYYWPVFRAQQFLFCGVVLVLVSLESFCSRLEQKEDIRIREGPNFVPWVRFTQRSVDLQNNPVVRQKRPSSCCQPDNFQSTTILV